MHKTQQTHFPLYTAALEEPGKLLEMIITILGLKPVLHIVSQRPILHLQLPVTVVVAFLPV